MTTIRVNMTNTNNGPKNKPLELDAITVIEKATIFGTVPN